MMAEPILAELSLQPTCDTFVIAAIGTSCQLLTAQVGRQAGLPGVERVGWVEETVNHQRRQVQPTFFFSL